MPDDGLTTDGRPRVVRYQKPKNGAKKEKVDIEDLKREVEMDEHKISLDQLCSELTTDPDIVSFVLPVICRLFFPKNSLSNFLPLGFVQTTSRGNSHSRRTERTYTPKTDL